MAYTPINWDENTLVDATKLDNMENGIQQNESDISDIKNGNNIIQGSQQTITLTSSTSITFSETGFYLIYADSNVEVKTGNELLISSDGKESAFVLSTGSNITIKNDTVVDRNFYYAKITI